MFAHQNAQKRSLVAKYSSSDLGRHSQEALEQVEKATDSDRANGEELLGSEDLKRQFCEAKEREAKRAESEQES